MVHEFVESVPPDMADNTIYVSIKYKTVIHKCACGCGNKVVTPLKPSQWALTFDGRSVSLYPSVGCGAFPCQSHYWIKNNKVDWSYKMTEKEIATSQQNDLLANKRYFEGTAAAKEQHIEVSDAPAPPKKKVGIGARLKKRFFGK